jgi:GGDEF domain-containing protein
VVCEYPTKLIDSFNNWFERQDTGQPLWPAFDRWLRDALNEHLDARRVRCFRVADRGNRLVSLTTQLEEPLWPPCGLPGLIAHVLATGKAYVHGDRTSGESIERLADQWAAAVRLTPGLKSAMPNLILPIRAANQSVGLVLVGERPGPAPDLTGLGGLLTIFWRHVEQAQALTAAEQTDRPSGVLTRADLCVRARQVLAESAGDGEPVVVLALAVEGVRRLDDAGHWALRDRLMRQVGSQMRNRLRSDDLVGRFSEDRFVAVLRRLDLALGRMIARKLLAAVEAVAGEQPLLQEMVRVRCGLSDAGENGLEAAVGRAFEALRLARLEDRNAPVVLRSGQHEEKLLAGGAP